MVDFSEYLNFLEELEHTLQQLVDVEQKKAAAVSSPGSGAAERLHEAGAGLFHDPEGL